MADKENIPAEVILEKFKQIGAEMFEIEELTRSLPRGLERQFLYEDYASIESKIMACEKTLKGITQREVLDEKES